MTRASKVFVVGIFGLDRCPAVTLPPFRSMILAPLENFGFKVIFVAHFNRPDVVNNKRNQESGLIPAPIRAVDYEYCDIVMFERQSDSNISNYLNLLLNTKYRDQDDTEFDMKRNALHQLYSLRKMFSMILSQDISRDALFFLTRPDLRYFDELPVEKLVNLFDGGLDIVLPFWQGHGGFNDRFAICNWSALSVYCNRLTFISKHIDRRNYFHPEELLKDVIQEHGLKFDFIDQRAARVRATGVVKDESWRY